MGLIRLLTLGLTAIALLPPTLLLSTSFGADGDEPLRGAIEMMGRVPTGKLIVERALQFWKLSRPEELVQVLRWGDASRTDAVLTRHYDPKSGAESRERQVTIYVRENQKPEALALDIAHEMIHATVRPSWDPYDPALTPGRYIRTAIEGEGGEVEAVMGECAVALELSRIFPDSAQRCEAYLVAPRAELPEKVPGHQRTIDKERVRADFYRVGRWHRELSGRLGSERALFPLLSPSRPKLYSSTGQAPYPVALLTEFEQITEAACTNSRKRLELLPDRAPASGSDLSVFLERRCPEPAGGAARLDTPVARR